MPKTFSPDPVKRRLQYFQNLYQNYYQWKSLVETENLLYITFPDGEEVYFYEVMIGFDALPPRQKQAFYLHVLNNLTEVESWERMDFKSKYTTLVGQYSAAALVSMVRAYDTAPRNVKAVNLAQQIPGPLVSNV